MIYFGWKGSGSNFSTLPIPWTQDVRGRKFNVLNINLTRMHVQFMSCVQRVKHLKGLRNIFRTLQVKVKLSLGLLVVFGLVTNLLGGK